MRAYWRSGLYSILFDSLRIGIWFMHYIRSLISFLVPLHLGICIVTVATAAAAAADDVATTATAIITPCTATHTKTAPAATAAANFFLFRFFLTSRIYQMHSSTRFESNCMKHIYTHKFNSSSSSSNSDGSSTTRKVLLIY